MTMTIDEKQRANDAIIGCDYVFPGEIETETVQWETKVTISLAAGKTWKPIYFTPGSAVLSTQESTPFAGRLIESKFEMKIPGGSADMTAELIRICSRAIVLKLTLESGDVLICGGKNRKLRLVAAGAFNTQKGVAMGFVYKSKKNFLWEV